MNTMNELTIVIPAKNEARLLPRLLNSLVLQDYPPISRTKVYLADAGSTDGTPEIARGYAEGLAMEVIPGGLPLGARITATPRDLSHSFRFFTPISNFPVTALWIPQATVASQSKCN